MSKRDPWATGFLANLLITFLEDRFPNEEARISYREILSAVEGFEAVRGAKDFLRDPGHWIPYRSLHDLIGICERVAGTKDASYCAALHYFESHPQRVSTLLEIIVKVLQDVRGVLLHGDSWAGAYTNYLRLQCIPAPASDHEMILLAQFDPSVVPRYGSFGLIRGNFEGFTRLYDFVEEAVCEPVVFQLSAEKLMDELGGHRIARKKDHIAIVETISQIVVAEGRAVRMAYEAVPKTSRARDSEEGLAREEGGCYHVITADKGSTGGSGTDLVEITRGGNLRHGGITLDLKPGWVFGAPYSRFRITWRERYRPDDPIVVPRERERISALLFTHVEESRKRHRQALDVVNANRNLSEENARLKESLVQENRLHRIVGKSVGMQDLYRLIEMVARTDSTVLITGETGTGKELVARAIHYNGPRKNRRFVALNCAAVVESLLESELFGHEKGSFTGALQQRRGKFEQAHGGTLFLDEIGELSIGVQVKLLRVLQEREVERVGGAQPIPVDVRVIAATNRDLAALVSEGKFRKDLFYRIHVVPVDVPPLRERLDDLPLLVEHFLERWKKMRGRVPVFPPDVLRILLNYDWPGNVRELENVVERMIALAPAELSFRVSHLPPALLQAATSAPQACVSSQNIFRDDWVNWPAISDNLTGGKSLNDVLGQIERLIVQRAVEDQGGNKTRAARLLKRSYRWLRKVEKGGEDQPTL